VLYDTYFSRATSRRPESSSLKQARGKLRSLEHGSDRASLVIRRRALEQSVELSQTVTSSRCSEVWSEREPEPVWRRRRRMRR